MKCIYTNKGADPQAPYSQAMITGNLIFTAGQVAMMPGTGESVGITVTEQAEQVCKNIGAILEAAGSSYEKVVKATCFLLDMADFDEFNAVYNKYFPHHPARICVAAAALYLDYRCEIEVIAEL